MKYDASQQYNISQANTFTCLHASEVIQHFGGPELLNQIKSTYHRSATSNQLVIQDVLRGDFNNTATFDAKDPSFLQALESLNDELPSDELLQPVH